MDIIIILSLITSAISTIAALYLTKMNKLKYNDGIELDLIRENYEEKIQTLNQKLVAETEKWKSVNHLLLNNEFKIKNLKEISIPEYFVNLGLDENMKIKEDQIFILMPFLKTKQPLYNKLKNITMNLGFYSFRSDDKFIEKNIYQEIVKQIASSKFIIADIDGRNANVFYELGIAHSLNKPTILISKNKNNIPFDLVDKNIIFYDNFVELEEGLKKIIPQLLIKISSKNLEKS